MTASQLAFDLPPVDSSDEADFLVTACNEEAFRFVKSWPEWPSHAAIIFGPPLSGKTHLACIWRAISGAVRISAGELARHEPPASPANFIIEDLDAAPFDETALFHRLNLTKEQGAFILLTGSAPPGQWSIGLPDLRSRLRSFPALAIREPDDELLAAMLLKHFSDRQLLVSPDVLPFLLSRMERSTAAARHVVETIDRLALSEQRKVTRAFAAKVMKELNPSAPDEEPLTDG